MKTENSQNISEKEKESVEDDERDQEITVLIISRYIIQTYINPRYYLGFVITKNVCISSAFE
jgi:hypothetical protein